MSLQPPGTAEVGQVWIDPITTDRYVFTGKNTDKPNYGWIKHANLKVTLQNLRSYLTSRWRASDGEVHPQWIDVCDDVLALVERVKAVEKERDDARHNIDVIDGWREKAEVEFDARLKDYANECAKLDNERYEAQVEVIRLRALLKEAIECIDPDKSAARADLLLRCLDGIEGKT